VSGVRRQARRTGPRRVDRSLLIGGVALVVVAVAAIAIVLSSRSGSSNPTFAQLAVGNCLDLPLTAITPAPPTPTPVPRPPGASPTPAPSQPQPSPDAVTTAVLAGQAGRVTCSGSHTHEVVGTTGIEVGEAYLGRAALLQISRPACTSSFRDYVGRDVAGSSLALTIVVPDEAAWTAKTRRAVCLASRADGTATTRTFKGSGL
jgi:putative regulator of septum formation